MSVFEEFDTWYNEVYFSNGQIQKPSDMQYEQKYGSAATKQYVRMTFSFVKNFK